MDYGHAPPSATSAARGMAAIASAVAFGTMLIFAMLPMTALFAKGIQIFDIAHEFITYRIGDALSMMFDDYGSVRPVQGLPNALLSKLITKTLYAFYGSQIVTPSMLQLYTGIFFAVCFAIIAGALSYAWPRLSWPERCAVAVAAITPWYVGPTTSVLHAPEYWFAEWAFLLLTLALLPLIERTPSRGDGLAAAVGAWLAVGLTTKVSMLGAAPILFLALPEKSWRAGAIFATSSAGAYLAILFAYSGFRPQLTFDILRFQIGFYVHPNVSQTYSNGLDALRANPAVGFLLAAAAGLSLSLPRGRRLAALAWLALYGYLIIKRPHSTSMASAEIGTLFVIGLALQRLSVWPGAVAAAAVGSFATVHAPYWLAREPYVMPPQARAFHGDILFMPGNNWNAATPIQALAYNGGLALRPPALDRDGKPTAPAPAFRAVFGNTVLLGESPTEITMMTDGLKKGMTVVWTRPSDSEQSASYKALQGVIRDAATSVSEAPVDYHGSTWLFGRASTRP